MWSGKRSANLTRLVSEEARPVPRGERPTRLVCQRNFPMSNKTGKRGRDAGTGQFMPVKKAEQRKKTALVETFKKDANGRPVN